MPNQILQMLITKRILSPFEYWSLGEYQRNCNEQELNYFTKVVNVLF